MRYKKNKASKKGISFFQDKYSAESETFVKRIQSPELCEALKQCFNDLDVDDVQECDTDPYMTYRLKLSRDGASLSVTQYSSGKLMLQGRASLLMDMVKAAIDDCISSAT